MPVYTRANIILTALLLFGLNPLFSEAKQDPQPSIAVLDFEPKGDIKSDTSDFVTERVRIELFKTGKYKIVERGQMKKVLEEQKLELSGLTGSEYASKVGKLLSAQKMLLGSVNKLDSSYYVNVRMIDVTSGTMEFGDTAQADSAAGLSDTSVSIVSKLTGGLNTQRVNTANSQNRSINPPFYTQEMETFVNSAIGYFMEKVGSAQSMINSFNPSTQGVINTASVSSVSSAGQSASAPGNNDAADSNDGIDNYVDQVKQNRDNYKSNKNKPDNSQANQSGTVNNEPKKETQDESGVGGMGGPLIKYDLKPLNLSEFNIQGNFLYVGGRGLWTVNRFFGLGGGGYGGILLNNSSSRYDMGLGYGGVILDLFYRFHVVRFDVNCLIGAGGYGIIDNNLIKTASNLSNTTNTIDPSIDSGSFFVVEPTFLVAFRLAPFMELGITGSYLFTSRVRNNTFDFNNYTVGLSLMFGLGG